MKNKKILKILPQEYKKIGKEVNKCTKYHLIALQIPLAQLFLGRKAGYMTPEKEKDLKDYAKLLIDTF